MNRFTNISRFIAGSALVAGLAGVVSESLRIPELELSVQAAGDQVLAFDVACDCRMGSPAFFNGNRGEAWIISGKIFPAGTLPTGTATNDPTQPVRGIAPIGEWTCRGQGGLPFPSSVGAAYDASPPAFNTQYFVFKNKRALTVEGYALPGFTGERLSVTGGIGGYAGIAGDVEEAPFGTNLTGCPNFRVRINVENGSHKNDSNR